MSKARDSRNEKKSKKKPGTKFHGLKSTRTELKKSARAHDEARDEAGKKMRQAKEEASS